MLVKLETLLVFLQEHSGHSAATAGKMIRGMSTATPNCDLFAKDEDRAREAELKKLRKLKQAILEWAKAQHKVCAELIAELD